MNFEAPADNFQIIGDTAHCVEKGIDISRVVTELHNLNPYNSIGAIEAYCRGEPLAKPVYVQNIPAELGAVFNTALLCLPLEDNIFVAIDPKPQLYYCKHSTLIFVGTKEQIRSAVELTYRADMTHTSLSYEKYIELGRRDESTDLCLSIIAQGKEIELPIRKHRHVYYVEYKDEQITASTPENLRQRIIENLQCEVILLNVETGFATMQSLSEST